MAKNFEVFQEEVLEHFEVRESGDQVGHYVADVFSFHQHSWYHYDDETAREKPEEDVLGHNLQCNGYVFFYMYRPLFDQMMSQKQESQDKDIMVK
uniref:USP domain-containing protein n=1 Tax=Timema tahoe TaxID=61484 RepID=A0A7R9P1B4_9NEOP|nr:unnamed protein product [Timema tahoe]